MYGRWYERITYYSSVLWREEKSGVIQLAYCIGKEMVESGGSRKI